MKFVKHKVTANMKSLNGLVPQLVFDWAKIIHSLEITYKIHLLIQYLLKKTYQRCSWSGFSCWLPNVTYYLIVTLPFAHSEVLTFGSGLTLHHPQYWFLLSVLSYYIQNRSLSLKLKNKTQLLLFIIQKDSQKIFV